MGRIPDEIIQRVRDRVDIVDLVGRYVALKPAGRNHKGLCPFHQEKTPSFVVTPDRQSFKCFGCGEGGSAFHFLMKLENLTFPEAVRTLASQVGVEVPESGGGDGSRIAPLFEANEIAQEAYRQALAERGADARRYLERRGLDDDAIERFGIGLAPDAWSTVADALRARRVPARVGVDAGLLKEGQRGHYDLLRGRITFPIRDARGRVVGFGGRALAAGQEPKYLNTPESPVFQKRRSFFGFPAALEPMRREGRAVVVEGYFDLIALERAGVEGVVATCGTALSEEHARELRRRTGDVVLLFDGDEAGQKAMERALEVLLPAGLRVHAAVLPAGEDPDDFLAREGPEALRALVAGAPSALEVAIRRAAAGGLASPAAKADAVTHVAPLLAKLPSPVERGAWEDQLALATGTNPDDVRAAVRALSRGEDPRDALPVAARVEPGEVRKLQVLARSLVEHPHLAPELQAEAFASLADVPVAELLRRLLQAAGADRRVDLEELAGGLSAPARSLLYALASEDDPLEEAAARQTVEDTRRWLADRAELERQRGLTERLRRGEGDPLELLRAKQQQARDPQHLPPRERTH